MMDTLQSRLLNIITNDKGLIASSRCNEKYLSKFNIWNEVESYLPFDRSIHTDSFMIKCIQHGLTEIPSCKVCGDIVKENRDKNRKGPFREFCSSKCAASTEDFKERFAEVDRNKAKAKRRQTMIDKYGVAYNSQRPEIKFKLEKRWKERIPEEAFRLLNDRDWLHEEYVVKGKSALEISKPLNVYYGTVLTYILGHGFKVRRGYRDSIAEKEILSFAQTLDQDAKKDWIGKKELDVLLPNSNLAIAHDGLFWHSGTTNEGKRNHLNKTELCESNDIQLLHIFEDEWIDATKRDIWKSIITHKAGKSPIKVYARQCKVENISASVARSFLEENHLHGFVGGTHLGLVKDDELVMLLTHGPNRFTDGKEILRIVSKKYVAVIGGLSKILSKLPAGEYHCYADRRYSTKSAYGSLLTLEGATGPNYSWTDKISRISRYSTQKSKLKNFLGEKFNPSKSEFQNMVDAGYRIIHDCGSWKFKYTKH